MSSKYLLRSIFNKSVRGSFQFTSLNPVSVKQTRSTKSLASEVVTIAQNSDSAGKPYLATLTPLRGIAAIFVVMGHSSLFFGSFVPNSVTAFFENAWIWVDFFFILSGFILAYSYSHYFIHGVTPAYYRKYLVARFARIYPLHLVTLLWAFLVVAAIVYMATSIDGAIADLYELKAFLPCLLLLQDLNIYKLSPLNFPSWSLSAEWWMYLLFPFFVPAFSKLTKLKALFVLFVLVVIYVLLIYGLGPVSGYPPVGKATINMVTDFGVLRCFAGFCTGMLLHGCYEARYGYAIFRNTWSFILFFLAALISIHVGVADILIIALFPFVLVSAAYNETSIKIILGNGLLQRLGAWSFSIYMVQGPIILMLLAYSIYKDTNLLSNVVASAGTEEPNYNAGLMYCAILLTLTLIVSALTYRFIEIPAGKYLKTMFKVKTIEVSAERVKRERTLA